MPSTNLYKRLKQILPEPPLLIGTVLSTTATGALVQLPDLSLVSVRGSATIGQHLFIRNGTIEGIAPTLPTVLIEI